MSNVDHNRISLTASGDTFVFPVREQLKIINAEITALEETGGSVGDLETRVAALETTVASMSTQITTLNGQVSALDSRVTALENAPAP
jgi:hypothetical protein